MAHELPRRVAGCAADQCQHRSRPTHGDAHVLLPNGGCGLGGAETAVGDRDRADEDQGHAVKVGKTLYVKTGAEWRRWLRANHKTAGEIWLIYYKKDSGKPRIRYNDAVEEALCYGWIDGISKPIDPKKYTQRFSPRKKTSRLSDMNRERVRRLIKAGRMTKAGMAAIAHTGKG